MNYFPKKISNNFRFLWKRFQNDESQSVNTATLLLKPETPFEKQLLKSKDFRDGLFWGEPRFGHPEGKVVFHIREVLQNIDKITTDKKERELLRIIAFVHDTFKYLEDKSCPRDWSKHHAVLARNFVQKYIDTESILNIVESHDDVFHAWNIAHQGNEAEALLKLNQLKEKLGDDLNLYYQFFLADTKTGDKIQAPVTWFEKEADLKVIQF